MHKKKFKYIQKNQIRIVSFKKKHLTHRYVNWLNDKEVVRFSEQRHKIHSIESCLEYFQQMEDSENYFLAVEILKKNKWIHIGNMSASVDFNNKIADLAIIIGDKSQWGKGYGSLAWCLTATALIEILNLRFVVAGTMSTNQPMLNIFKKTNMNIELKVKKYFLLDGNEIDLIIATGERRIFEKYLSKN